MLDCESIIWKQFLSATISVPVKTAILISMYVTAILKYHKYRYQGKYVCWNKTL
jgi:hypothetical protein